MAAHLLCLSRMGIDNGDLSRLCKPFALPFYHRLINAGLYYLVTGVVRPVHVKPFLIESEADRKGGILYQNEMGRFKRHRKRLNGVQGTIQRDDR